MHEEQASSVPTFPTTKVVRRERSFAQEVYNRIRMATNAKTQLELANLLEIRQSSISDAKRRDSVPSEWYMKLFEKFGLNPDWLKNGIGPMYLRTDEGYIPSYVKNANGDSICYSNPISKSVLTTVYSMQCHWEEKMPLWQAVGKIALPQTFSTPQMLVFKVESDSLAPTIRRSAYIGINTGFSHPVSGEIFGILMPLEGLVLKRLFLDAEQNRFILRSDQTGYPESSLLVEECETRIVGRVAWVLQKF